MEADDEFTEWLSAVAPPQASAAPPAPPQSETPGAGADRFSKAGNWRIPVSEFGRKMDPISGTPAPPEPQVPPLPSDPNPPTPEPPAPVVGEFTRMFEAATRNDSQVGAAPQIEDVGEFTRMFEAQNPPASGPPAPQQPRPPVKEAAGEFTRMFQTPSAPPAPPASPISSEYNRVFQGADSNPNVNLNETMEMPAASRRLVLSLSRSMNRVTLPECSGLRLRLQRRHRQCLPLLQLSDPQSSRRCSRRPLRLIFLNIRSHLRKRMNLANSRGCSRRPPHRLHRHRRRPWIGRSSHPIESRIRQSRFVLPLRNRRRRLPASSRGCSKRLPRLPRHRLRLLLHRPRQQREGSLLGCLRHRLLRPRHPRIGRSSHRIARRDRHSRFSRTLPKRRRPVPATSLGCSRPRRRHDRLRKRRHKLLLLLHRPRRQREESLLGCLRHRLPRPLHLRIGRSSHRIARRDRHSRFTRTLPNYRRPVPATSLGCSRPRPRHDRLRKRRHRSSCSCTDRASTGRRVYSDV